MKPAYYNEWDDYAAAWLRNLIARGLIAPGDVDQRSITDVRADDLRGYGQCHFFAGIGGWSHALRLAGWPDDRPVWTGSCPCQPFSTAGLREGFADERHLWPAWHHLIRERRPPVLFGEQVANGAALPWVDLVQADLEDEDYAVWFADLCAAGVGAPHIRQRLYWVAHAGQEQWRRRENQRGPSGEDAPLWNEEAIHDQRCGTAGLVAHTDGRNTSAERQQRSGQQRQQPQDGGTGALADSAQVGWRQRSQDGSGGVARDGAQGPRRVGLADDGDAGFWSGCDWIDCTDGKARPVEPGTFPLAHGIPNRVGRLRAYGNAIVPQVAAVFVMANVRGNRGPTA